MSDAGKGAAWGAIGGPIGAGIGALIGSRYGNPDPTSFTSTNPHDSTAPGNIAFQGVNPSQDSGTQFFRSLTNKSAKEGDEENQAGKADVGGAKGNLQKVLDYFGHLLGGNREEVLSSISPETDQISTQFNHIRTMLSQGGARGGGTASTLATLPQQETAQVSDLINKSRRTAATGLQSAAKDQSGIGFNEQQLGQSQLDRALQAELAKLGINLGERGQNAQLGTSLGTAGISALI